MHAPPPPPEPIVQVKAAVQDGGSHLQDPVSAFGLPAHLAAAVQPGVDQLVNPPLRVGRRDQLTLTPALVVIPDDLPMVPDMAL